MGKIRDVEIIISRLTRALSEEGFGIPLILSSSKGQSYKQYEDIGDVLEDFQETSEEYKIANAIFNQEPSVNKIAIAGIIYDGIDATVLVDALKLVEGEYYFVLSPEQDDAEITAISNYIETQKKQYFASTSNETLLAELTENTRTTLLIHDEPEKYPAEAWVGRCAAVHPGKITWKFKTLNGISAGEYEDIDDIIDNNGNIYYSQGGKLMTAEGVTTSGDFIDIIRSQDYIESRMAEAVFGVLTSADKVPYSNKGIKLIGAAVETTLKQSFESDMIAEDADGNAMYSVQLPTRESVSFSDRTNRILPDIYWQATLSGAIHKVKPIRGLITV